jgi:hypothetical protein
VTCPFCRKTVNPDSFKDPLSVVEYRISGLCQSCQDGFFDPVEEAEAEQRVKDSRYGDNIVIKVN